MTSMTFVAACSPASAQFLKNLNAAQYSEQYPEAVKASHYVDDYVKSFDDVQIAKRVTEEVVQIHDHKAGCFQLRGFVSNCRDLLEHLGVEDPGETKFAKVLGLIWDAENETLKYKIPFHRFPEHVMNGNQKPTKREVLMMVMSSFDPVGFLNDFTIHGRLLIQELWEYKLSWDSQIPDASVRMRKEFQNGLHSISKI